MQIKKSLMLPLTLCALFLNVSNSVEARPYYNPAGWGSWQVYWVGTVRIAYGTTKACKFRRPWISEEGKVISYQYSGVKYMEKGKCILY